MRFAFVFPGQGSQSLNMMAAYGDHPVIKATFDEASQALGRDLWKLVTEGSVEAINQTVNTQPLMLTADVAVWRLWKALGGAQPAMMAGHSLGEYAALVATEALKFSDAVPLVASRAEAMQAAVPEGTGAMAAILGLDAAMVQTVCREVGQAGQVVEAVNFNSPEQTVIAGHKAAVEQAAETCKIRGAKRAILLPVSAPSHCRLMQPAAEKLAELLAIIPITTPQIPVLNNVDVVCAESAEDIRAALVRQVAAPVRWVEIQRALERTGVTHVFECGPGKVLTGLVKRCAETLVGGSMNDAASLNAAYNIVKG